MAMAGALEERFVVLIAQETGCRPQQVEAASQLFAEKATVPFVARYRKEATGGLIDEQLETIFKRREYFLDLMERRDAILASIAEQGKLTESLAAAIRASVSKQELEDLYLPYKPKRRTRAQMAREKGLEPLADGLLEMAGGSDSAESLAAAYIDDELGVEDADGALAGARDILAERLAEDAEHRAHLRKALQQQGELNVRVLTGKETEGQVYKDYFEYSEPARAIASHRLLAILRGEREGILISDLAIDDDAEVESLGRTWRVPLDTPCGRHVAMATSDGYKRLLRPSISNEVRGQLRQQAEQEAIRVFRENLEALLMQSPIGQVPVMGLDPGYRTGCKLAVVDRTGRVVATDVIYPIAGPGSPQRVEEAEHRLVESIKKHQIHAVAVGNGTGSRETETFARQVAKRHGLDKVIVAIVPETGASVYSASAVARDELPDLDVSLRGAVSIARRLQDPLAELVKIDPKSMGVGQYQHDVDQKSLAGELDVAVESTVNRVGVELNTASLSLLRRVSGLSERLARNIVKFRDAKGSFDSRDTLLQVSGFGPKTYEQAAGFLRIGEGKHPLDRTAVHPERYPVVEKMATGLGVPLQELVGNPALVATVNFERFLDHGEGLGRFTLDDIRSELERPGRDPRPQFKAPEWREDVTSVDDLQPGMVLEGRVSNVTNFGAFVDIGVKRDGLVHLSELSNRWLDDPREAIKVGEVVKVKVIEVDRERQRIGLSIKQLLEPVTEPRHQRRNSDNATSGAQGPEAKGPAAKGPGTKSPRPGTKGPRPTSGQGNNRSAKGRSTDDRGAGRGAPIPRPTGPPSVADLAAKFNRKPRRP